MVNEQPLCLSRCRVPEWCDRQMQCNAYSFRVAEFYMQVFRITLGVGSASHKATGEHGR
jgi:hypothetical protein